MQRDHVAGADAAGAQPGGQPASLDLDVTEGAREGSHRRVHDEAGVGVGVQSAGDEIAKGVLRPPPLVDVAFRQLDRDVSHGPRRTSDSNAMLFSDRENANTADGERLMVDLELDDGLAIITIDRPHARNAISLETMDQLEKALDGAEGAAALVITGAGDRAFVSGGDLKELSALRTELEASSMAFRMRSICDRIAGFPTPTIAALNGHALAAAPSSRWRPTSGLPPTTSRSASIR